MNEDAVPLPDKVGPDELSKKVEYLREQLKLAKPEFDAQSKRHKVWHRSCRVLVFILTGLSSVLAGVAAYYTRYQVGLNVGILVATASIGAITSFEGLRKFAELWIMERNVHNALSDLERKFEYTIRGPYSDSDIDGLFERFQQIMSESGEKWTHHFAGATGKKP